MLEQNPSQPEVYCTSVVISRIGEIIATYRKRHMPGGGETFAKGDSPGLFGELATDLTTDHRPWHRPSHSPNPKSPYTTYPPPTHPSAPSYNPLSPPLAVE